MPYTDRYGSYLDAMPGQIAAGKESQKTPVFAYTSNLDVVLKWDAETYNRILDQYLKEEPSVHEGDRIRTLEDFARITCFYLMRGLGGNFDITENAICEFLKEQFHSEYSLGGTCAQGASAIGTMGFPVSVHLTDKSREVCGMLDHDGTTVIRGNRMIPVSEGSETKFPVYHFILQFKKDDEIRVFDRKVKIPLSNRMILFFDTIHKKVPVDADFLRYWEDPGHGISSYLISGFDAVIDPKIMEERLQELEPHLDRVKKNHPNAVLYFEGAFYMNPAVKDLSAKVFCRYADILGTNEEELTEQTERFGIKIDASKPEELFRGLTLLLSEYPVKGIILHTKDYAMYFGEELPHIDIEEGLTIGNLMAGTRARIGKYGTPEECRETLSLPPSSTGLAMAEEVKKWKTDRMTVVVPSKYLEYPKYTIGLGDTFVSGVHTCFF